MRLEVEEGERGIRSLYLTELFWTGEERCQSWSLNLERNVCSELTMRICNTGTVIRHILTCGDHCNKLILAFIYFCLWSFSH